MRRPLHPLLLACALACTSVYAQAQSSPIPDTRVPGFGGTDTHPGGPGGSPSASGSNTGSNMGAGANASPSADIVTPSVNTPPTSDVPPTGTGTLTITR